MSDRAAANTEAHRRLCASEPRLVDVRPAGEVVPGYRAEPDPHVGRAAAVRRVHRRTARGDHRRRAVRGPRRRRARRRSRSSSRARSRSTARTATAASARWPASTPPRCRCSWSRTRRSATPRSATSTRARSAAGSTTAATTPASTSGSSTSTACSGRWSAPRCAPRRHRAGADHAPRRADGRRVPLALRRRHDAVRGGAGAAAARPGGRQPGRRARAVRGVPGQRLLTSCGSRWRPARRPATRRTASRARPS